MKQFTPVEIADARLAVLQTIAHLKALALFAQTNTQKICAEQLVDRLTTTVLPLVDVPTVIEIEVHR